MEPSWIAEQWIESFKPYSMGEPLIPTRSDLLKDDQSVNKQLYPITTEPIAATSFNLKLSECVVDTITKIPVTQLCLVQQSNVSSCQLPTAKRTIDSYSPHNYKL